MRIVVTAALAAAITLPFAPTTSAAPARRAAAPPAPTAPGARVRLTGGQMRDLASAVFEVTRSDSAVKAIEHHLAGNPDSSQIAQLRVFNVHGQITMSRTYGEIAFAVTNYLVSSRTDTLGTVRNLVEFSDRLVERVDCQHLVRQYCNRVLNLISPRTDSDEMRSRAWELLARRELTVGNADSAAALFERALPASARRQTLLRYLGNAYEKAGEREKALDAYLRSAATYFGADSSAAGPLRTLWADMNGSLAGLDSSLAAAREVSHREVVFDSKRWEKPAPDWSLPDLEGRTVKLADLRGKIVVLSFWGSWCEPCKRELPLLEKLHRELGSRGVEFVAANWEVPQGTAADRAKAAKEYVTKEKLTLPVVLDDGRQVADAYTLNTFPTSYLIDREGRIRYRNVGFGDGGDQILREQLEEMLKAE